MPENLVSILLHAFGSVVVPSHSLRVHLADVGQSLCQSVTRHLISKFVFELCRLALSALHESSRVGDGPGHNTAHRRRDPEYVRDGSGIDELVLIIESVRPPT